jgi:hypothetical protein
VVGEARIGSSGLQLAQSDRQFAGQILPCHHEYRTEATSSIHAPGSGAARRALHDRLQDRAQQSAGFIDRIPPRRFRVIKTPRQVPAGSGAATQLEQGTL